jgi:hypothetical protein
LYDTTEEFYWSRLEIGAILLHVNVYAGVYSSICDFMAAKEVFEEIDCQTTTVQTIRTGATVKHEGLRRVRGYRFSDRKSAEWSERT